MSSTVTGVVFNIQKFCIHDGPGIRTTVFFKGCPLRCRWCANPESQNCAGELLYDPAVCLRCGCCTRVCPQGAVSLEEDGIHLDRERCRGCGACAEACAIYGGKALSLQGQRRTVQEVVDEALKDLVFYQSSGGGVTFSGGEVLAQLDFAETVAAELHRHGVHIACETTGYALEAEFDRLLAFADLLLYDVKHYDDEAHRRGTGVSNRTILANLERAIRRGCPVIARIPIIPGYNDRPADAEEFGRLLQSMDVQEVHLLPFHQFGQGKYEKLERPYDYDGLPSLQKEDLEPLKQIVEQYVPKVQIGG